jgi:uncharacterized protein involved in exopolysaccharide biosynthesis
MRETQAHSQNAAARNGSQLSSITASLLLEVVERRWRFILLTFFIVFGAAAAVTLLLPKKYESGMKILVKNERPSLVVTSDGSSGGAYRGEVNEAEINSEIELLSSVDLLRTVVVETRLYEDTEAVHATGEPSPIGVERALDRLRHDLQIEPVRKSNVIQITYRAASPELATAVLKQLTEFYLTTHVKAHSVPGTSDFFNRQADHYEASLHEAELRLAEFRQRYGIVSIEDQKQLLLTRVNDIERMLQESDAQIAEFTARGNDINRQLSTIERRINTQTKVLPNQSSIERLTTMLAELQNKRTELAVEFRSDDRIIRQIDEQFGNTQAALERERQARTIEETTDVNPVPQRLESDAAEAQVLLAGALARKESIQKVLGAERQSLALLEGGTVTYDALVRNVKDQEANYLMYARKREEARTADSLDQQRIGNVAIAESPTLNYIPKTPQVGLSLAIGSLLAAIVSIGGTVGLEFRARNAPSSSRSQPTQGAL